MELQKLVELNKQLEYQKKQVQVLQSFSGKKEHNHHTDVLHDRDMRDALTFKMQQTRQTRHLKREQVSKDTYAMQLKQETAKKQMQKSDSAFMETFTGDSIQKVF